MSTTSSTAVTGFARLSPLAARALLLVGVLLTCGAAALTLTSLRKGYADAADRGVSDLDLYRAEVERIRVGEGYYQAAATELRARGYPTRSVFNWRALMPMWLLGKLPRPVSYALLGAICLGVLLWGFDWMARECGVRSALFGVLMLGGAMLPCALPDLYVAPELWSGMLIALSACAYGRGRPHVAVAAGIGALFFRELAAPWCVLCLGLALWERRWRELLGWCLGLAAYAVFYAWHVHTVRGLIRPDDPAHAASWLAFGGAAQLLSTAQMNVWLLLVPQSLTAIFLALALLGAAAWQGSAGQRLGLGIAAYVAGFAIVGQDFNQYWGSMYAPILALAVARSPGALRDLWRAAGMQVRAARTA